MSLATVVQALTDFADECESEYTVAYNESDDGQPPAEAIAVVLLAIRECRAGLAEFADQVERDLLALMDEKKLVIEGVGEIEAKKSTKRTQWQNTELARRVIALAYDERQLDETTGEYEREGDAIARVLLSCARPSWRLEALRHFGIDPDEWCTVEEDSWSVRLPPRALR